MFRELYIALPTEQDQTGLPVLYIIYHVMTLLCVKPNQQVECSGTYFNYRLPWRMWFLQQLGGCLSKMVNLLLQTLQTPKQYIYSLYHLIEGLECVRWLVHRTTGLVAVSTWQVVNSTLWPDRSVIYAVALHKRLFSSSTLYPGKP